MRKKKYFVRGLLTTVEETIKSKGSGEGQPSLAGLLFDNLVVTTSILFSASSRLETKSIGRPFDSGPATLERTFRSYNLRWQSRAWGNLGKWLRRISLQSN